MFKSATFKLTMWYLAIVMAISVLFSVVLYNVATAELMRGLHRETQRIYNQFPVFQNSPMLHQNSDYAVSAHHLLLRIIGLNLLVFAAAGAASYLLARRTLSPIEEAHQQQQRFTADVSHELRTPLTAIKMESEVALFNTESTINDLRDTITSNLEETAKLEGLINNLLRLTRLEESELRHSFNATSIISLVEDAVAGVTKIASSRQIIINQNLQDGLVQADVESLQQLIVILLDNAIKYSSVGEQIMLDGTLVGAYYVLNITDNGLGIEPAALEHIFERFYRADSSRLKTDTEGYGLGLSIAKMIADVHHATITVTSQPKHGTVVKLSLPLAKQK